MIASRFAPLALSALFASILAGHGRAQAMDVEHVSVYATIDRLNGTVSSATPYGFTVQVEGTNIASVSVETPGGATHGLVAVGGNEWRYRESMAFATLCDMSSASSVGFGDFELTFTPLAGSVQTATVTWDPGCTDPHSGYASITFPANGQTGVTVNPTFTWTCANGPCGNFAWYLEAFPTGGVGLEYDEGFLPPSATAWTPGCLSGSTSYGFWISAGTILGGGPQTLETSPDNDSFLYDPGFETINEISFTTEAGTVTAVATSRNGTGLNASCYTSVMAPTVGGTWVGEVSHAAHPGATCTAVVGHVGGATGLVNKYGEILVDFASPRVFQSLIPSAGTADTHSIPIPNDPCLAGFFAATQGVIIGGGVELCNAVDFVVGS